MDWVGVTFSIKDVFYIVGIFTGYAISFYQVKSGVTSNKDELKLRKIDIKSIIDDAHTLNRDVSSMRYRINHLENHTVASGDFAVMKERLTHTDRRLESIARTMESLSDSTNYIKGILTKVFENNNNDKNINTHGL